MSPTQLPFFDQRKICVSTAAVAKPISIAACTQLQRLDVMLPDEIHYLRNALMGERGEGVLCCSENAAGHRGCDVERVLCMQEEGSYAEAEAHCLRLMDVGGVNKDKAKALLREIRALQAQQSSTPQPSGTAHYSMRRGQL